MKKSTLLALLFLLVGLFAVPADAQRGGPGMMGGGQWGHGWWGSNAKLDEKKSKEIFDAWQKHYQATADLRREIWIKRHEMATLLSNPKTKKDALLKKHDELQKLVNRIQREQLVFRWELYQKYPEFASDPYGGCFGPGMCFDDSGGGMPYYGYGRGRMWGDSGYGWDHMMGPGGYGRGPMRGPGYYGPGWTE